jgi:hypothetical protein
MATRRLDRRARTAIAIAVALLFAGPLYWLPTGHLEDQRPQQIAHPDNDGLVMLSGWFDDAREAWLN